MTAKGHMVLASTIATISFLSFNIFKQFSNVQLIFIYTMIIAGSVLPDIDEDESYIGKKMGAISIIFSTLFKHRTITHYLIFVLFIASLSAITNDLFEKYLVLAVAFGVLLHDVGDMLTIGGIRGFFFPFFKKKKIVLLPKFLRFYTNSATEYIFIFFLNIINLYAIYLNISERI